jgi:hypothetical protein
VLYHEIQFAVFLGAVLGSRLFFEFVSWREATNGEGAEFELDVEKSTPRKQAVNVTDAAEGPKVGDEKVRYADPSGSSSVVDYEHRYVTAIVHSVFHFFCLKLRRSTGRID